MSNKYPTEIVAQVGLQAQEEVTKEFLVVLELVDLTIGSSLMGDTGKVPENDVKVTPESLIERAVKTGGIHFEEDLHPGETSQTGDELLSIGVGGEHRVFALVGGGHHSELPRRGQSEGEREVAVSHGKDTRLLGERGRQSPPSVSTTVLGPLVGGRAREPLGSQLVYAGDTAAPRTLQGEVAEPHHPLGRGSLCSLTTRNYWRG